MAETIIRMARKEDAVHIQRILHSAHRENRRRGYFFPISTVTRKTLLTLMKRDRYFVLERHGIRIGTIALRTRHGSVEIRSLAVLNSYKRHGFGKKLMRYAERRAKQMGYRQIRLQTFKDHRMLMRFYRKRGYLPGKTYRSSRWVTLRKKI